MRAIHFIDLLMAVVFIASATVVGTDHYQVTLKSIFILLACYGGYRALRHIPW